MHTPPGALKINVHGVHTMVPRPNGNTTGIGAAYRDGNGELKMFIVGVIHRLSRVGNQLWAKYCPM